MSWLFAALLSTLSTFVGAPAPDCVIVEFSVENCGPCRQLQPALEKLKSEGWDVRTVNAERDPALVRKHAIQSLPTLLLISNGKEVDRIVGAAPYDKILPRLAKLLLASNANKLNSSSPQPDAPKIQAPSSTQFGRSEPAAEAEKWQSATPSRLSPDPGITVRGQSPVGAFPMLAAATNSAITSSPSSQAIAEKFEKLGATTNQLVSNSTPVLQPDPTPAYSHQPDRLPSRQPSQPRQTAQQQPPVKSAAPIDLQKAIARAEAATVRIRVDEENSTAYGTGTVIDVHGDEALVLTCGHLFREMKLHSQLTIDLFAGRSQPMNIPAQLIDFRADAGDVDIGLVSFKLPFAIEPVPLLPQGESLAVRQPAFSFGCDHGENPTRRDTQIKSINRYMGAPNVEIAGAPAVGRSGGGLFDHQGRLIGVCNAADAEGDEGIYAAAGIVYAQIERLQLTHLFNDKVSPPAAPVQFASNQTTIAPNSSNQSLNSFSSEPNHQASLASDSRQPEFNPQAAASAIPPVAASAAPSRLTCIVRDPNGQERIVTIDAPSPDLLDAIHRQARR